MSRGDIELIFFVIVIMMFASCQSCDDLDHMKQSLDKIEKTLEIHNGSSGLRDKSP